MEKPIDPSLVNIIKTLNKLNYKTCYSCSGLYKDHPQMETIRLGLGYISFKELNKKQSSILKKICFELGLYFDWSDCDSIITIRNMFERIAKPGDINMTLEMIDQLLENQWKRFIERIKDEQNNN